MISKFFIDRPVFATVLSIVIVLAGPAAMMALPVEQYPEIVPPEVVVAASYQGANAEPPAETGAAPSQQQVNGVEEMILLDSTSSEARKSIVEGKRLELRRDIGGRRIIKKNKN